MLSCMNCLTNRFKWSNLRGTQIRNSQSHVYLLQKAIYGLKQVPWAWFHRFNSFLLTLGFRCSTANTSLFIFYKSASTLYLLIYVDDIIVTSNIPSAVDKLVAQIRQEFATKDLGRLNYFLGLEVHYTDSGLFLGQSKYAHYILLCANLPDAKPISSPLASSEVLQILGTPFAVLCSTVL